MKKPKIIQTGLADKLHSLGFFVSLPGDLYGWTFIIGTVLLGWLFGGTFWRIALASVLMLSVTLFFDMYVYKNIILLKRAREEDKKIPLPIIWYLARLPYYTKSEEAFAEFWSIWNTWEAS